MATRARATGVSFDVHRLAESLRADQKDLFDNFMRQVDRIDAKLDHVQRDIRLGGREREQMSSEIADVRLQLGELRDTVRQVRTQETEHAAKTAATATVEAASPVISAAARKTSPMQWGALVMIGMGALFEFIDKGPKIANAVIVFVKGLASLK